MNGTLERVYPTLSSDPPLSTVAILGLLAGADEAKIADLETRRDDNAQRNLAATGAATLAAGVISEEMGLERGAARPRPRPLLDRPLGGPRATSPTPPPASPWASASPRT